MRSVAVQLAGFALLAAGWLASPAVAAPTIDPADDEQHFGVPEDILFWTPEQQVAGYRNMPRLFETRRIPASTQPLPLPRKLLPLEGVELEVDGQTMRLDDYFIDQSVAGLLVIKDGTIVYERYGLGNTENSTWVSYSVTKSVVSMLFGAALKEGYINSLDDPVTDYLPRLKASSYAGSSIRNLLQMASGVAWNEDYADPEADINQADWATLPLYEFLRDRPRVAAPGEVFNYNTAETNLAGTLLRSAIGNNLSTYLYNTIWEPFGMEADAWWNLTEPGGGEFGGCCISAILRDLGRIGLFALGDGRLPSGEAVLPPGWMAESTSPSAANQGYGYFWWLGPNGTYGASGIFGQGIHINPAQNLVIALQSARPKASDRAAWAWQIAMYRAMARELGAPVTP